MTMVAGPVAQAEKFKLSDDAIATVSPMWHSRYGAEAVVCGGRIFVFVFGGSGRTQLSSFHHARPTIPPQRGKCHAARKHFFPFHLPPVCIAKVHSPHLNQLSDAPAVHMPELGILVVGGVEEPDKKSRTAELLEMNNGDGGTWTAIAPMIELKIKDSGTAGDE